MKADKEEILIREEQVILDRLIAKMDKRLMELDKSLTEEQLKIKKSNVRVLPDAYGSFVYHQDELWRIKHNEKNLIRSRNELYDTRLELTVEDLDRRSKPESMEIKVGLHTYSSGNSIFVMSWKRPVCRHFLLDNASQVYIGLVEDKKQGATYKTRFTLNLKRKIDLSFDEVTRVVHMFPILTEEEKQIIADEFLQELLDRRTEQEFRNIIFSIQRKQGEIIQTPFKQDIIVQGCAGSGKSMIMLHRLPILLYDNPRDLSRTGLYIITPSIAYIQMVANLSADLEIEDIKMGTLKQYYDYSLQKYGLSEDVYGRIDPTIKLSRSKEEYVYSNQCRYDICRIMGELINKGKVDLAEAQRQFGLSPEVGRPGSWQEVIRGRILSIQRVINRNEEALRDYNKIISEIYDSFEKLSQVFKSRRFAEDRQLSREIEEIEKKIRDINLEIAAMNPLTQRRAVLNRKTIRLDLQQQLINLQRRLINLETNKTFDSLEALAQEIDTYLELHRLGINPDLERDKYKKGEFDTARKEYRKSLYDCIMNKDEIGKFFIDIKKKAEDPLLSSILQTSRTLNITEEAVKKLENTKTIYLKPEYAKQIESASNYYNQLLESITDQTYYEIMDILGQKEDEKGRITALDCSPFLYLRIMYYFVGEVPKNKDILITIDEAQDLAPAEIELIKNINGQSLIMNLFGDVRQHLEDTKGLDDWREISHVKRFKTFTMRENYRNARQITNYCNEYFVMKMRPINLDGAGVHTISNENEFVNEIKKIFQQPKGKGLSAIVVHDANEAIVFLRLFSQYRSLIHNMTEGTQEFELGQWNLMTCRQIKGLEFETVIVITGHMTQNEKYIAFTRALDELYIFEGILEEAVKGPIISTEGENIRYKDIGLAKGKRQKREKREKEVDVNFTKPLKDFFLEKGCTVIDKRGSGGCLWVIGDKSEIDNIIMEATKIYHISGFYSAGKATQYRAGWYTKSKL